MTAGIWANAVRRHPRKAAMRLVRLERLEAAGQIGRSTVAEAETLVGLRDALRAAERCQRCGRRLTDEESIARGIGPDCATKAEAVAATGGHGTGRAGVRGAGNRRGNAHARPAAHVATP